ncbi:MAG: tetraacyldisaccharide 4'-kinase [Bacteroidota bacterium]
MPADLYGKLKWIAAPFALLYAAGAAARNYMFDRGLKRGTEFTLPVICIGNLSVGGTGKTPHTEYLIRLLSRHFGDLNKPAVLSRGYGRSTKGYIQASPGATAKTIGDEPMQFYAKFGNNTVIAVSEDRAFAVPHIISDNETVNAIILDDAFQHRYVKPGLNILLTDYSKPFYHDFVLPMGRLRESRSGAKRANIIVVTKCPANLSAERQKEIEKNVKAYAGQNKTVFFSGLRYRKPAENIEAETLSRANTSSVGNADSISNSEKSNLKVILFAGLANPALLHEYVASNFKLAGSTFFNDHHFYTVNEINDLAVQAKSAGAVLLTTEKDIVKLQGHEMAKALTGVKLLALPIEIYFLSQSELFDRLILDFVESFSPKN